MELVLPSPDYKTSFIEAVREFQRESSSERRAARYLELDPEQLESYFEEYINTELSHAEGKNLPDGYVPETTYWLIDDVEFIGRVSIRHRLTDHLLRVGGHIGYDIRPSKRKRGYGTHALKFTLQKAKELGIFRVLVTCDATNEGSRRIIERNGGVLENSERDKETEGTKLRYWIENA